MALLHGLSRAWISEGVSDFVVYSHWKMCSRCLYHTITWGTAAMSPRCVVLSSGLQGHGHLELVLITSWQPPDSAAMPFPSSSRLLCAGFSGRRKGLMLPNKQKKPTTTKKGDKRDRCFSKGERQQKVQQAKQGKD